MADLSLCLRAKRAAESDEDVCVIAGDMLFQDEQFDLTQVVNFHNSRRHEGDTAIYYELDDGEEVRHLNKNRLCSKTCGETRWRAKRVTMLECVCAVQNITSANRFRLQ